MMKKVLSLMLVVLLCLTFTACGEEDKAADATNATNAAATDSALVGTWVGDKKVVFNADGTGSVDNDPFKWTATGNTVTVTSLDNGENSLVFTYAVSGNTLSMINDEGDSAVYTKEGASTESTTTTAPTESQSAIATADRVDAVATQTAVVTTAPQVATPSIVGSWKGNDDSTMVINADGTMTVTSDGENINMTWSATGDQITVSSNGQTMVISYSLLNNVLTMVSQDGDVITYVKGDSSAQTQIQTTITTTAAQMVTGDSGLVGTWLADSGVVVIFNADGTGMLGDDAITWSTNGSILTVTSPAHQETETVLFGISGNSMTFFEEDSTVVMTFTKQ